MNISSFLNSYPGMYVSQSFFHSLIASIIVGRAVHQLGIGDPRIRQRFCILAILFPIFSFPLYQLITPERSSLYFRMDALFDSSRWLNMEIVGKMPVSLLFIVILLITSLIFFFQEMLPIARHVFEAKKDVAEGERPTEDSVVSRMVESLTEEKPDLYILDDDPMLFSRTGNNPAIFLSTGLIEELSHEQLRAAIAHEIAHIRRSKRPLLMIVFALRAPMFFNPVVLLEFRKAVQEEEKICDDIAVSLTKNPHAMVETLKKFHHTAEAIDASDGNHAPKGIGSIEEHGHNLLLESRIQRIEKGSVRKEGSRWFEFIITILIIAGINYYVV